MLEPHAETPAATRPTADAVGDPTLTYLVDSLCGAGAHPALYGTADPCRQLPPAREVIVQLVDALRSVLFPGYFGIPQAAGPENLRSQVRSTLEWAGLTLEEQVKRALCFACPADPGTLAVCGEKAAALTRAFLARLPHVQRMLAMDVRAAYEGDPAATCPQETILCYPGILAVTSCRLAHELHTLGVPLIPRMITERAHSLTGIDIHPGAAIGEEFFIDHGTGVVIGETCIIGSRVRLYQGVTLGAKSFPLDEHGNPVKGIPRHPIVEDDVIIYSGATVLGRVVIGRGSVIGGNVWLTRDVPPGSRISQTEAHQGRFRDGAGI